MASVLEGHGPGQQASARLNRSSAHSPGRRPRQACPKTLAGWTASLPPLSHRKKHTETSAWRDLSVLRLGKGVGTALLWILSGIIKLQVFPRFPVGPISSPLSAVSHLSSLGEQWASLKHTQRHRQSLREQLGTLKCIYFLEALFIQPGCWTQWPGLYEHAIHRHSARRLDLADRPGPSTADVQ